MTEHKNQEGKPVPNVTFKTRVQNQWREVTTAEIFKGQNVVAFSLPGAFTPTCSSTHLPRYDQLAPVLKQHGIDRVVCLSVNDAFVMEAWGKEQHAENIEFLPDGNGEFTKGMEQLVDKSDIGFGPRSWRYSMLVKDGVVEKMFIEPDQPGDPFEVSDADTMLNYLAPDAVVPPVVSIFTRVGCPFCTRAKELLVKYGHNYSEIILHQDISQQALNGVSGRHTVPQVYFDGQHIGGSEELESYLKK